jgi:peptidoglycan/LPS O-acetylase OafA/YrhL
MKDQTTASGRNHLIVLDSLRGICASFVVLFHFEGDAFLRTLPFIKNGFLFVDFFFVLSGFVIAASYGEKIRSGFSILHFLFLRLGRLYPLYIFVLCCYLVTVSLKAYFDVRTGSTYTSPGLLLNVFLSQVWIPYAPQESDPWNPVSWSISAEFWMYIVFAVICRVGARALSAVGFRNVFVILILSSLPILIWGTDRYLAVCYSISGFARCVFGFSFGVLAYEWWTSGRLEFFRDIPTPTMTVLEIVACALSLSLVSLAGPFSLLCPFVFSLTICLFAFGRGAVSDILTTKYFTWIGALSYSIYMVHDFLLARFINAIQFASKFIALPISLDAAQPFAIFNSPGNHFAADAVIVCFYIGVVLVSWLTYNYIEVPFREASRTMADRGLPLSAPET